MLTIIKQIKRNWADDGRADKSFYDEEYRLKIALARVAETSQEVVKASQKLTYLLGSEGRLIH